MKTQQSLKVTCTGGIEYHPAWPVEPEKLEHALQIPLYEIACKEAEFGWVPVQNKEVAMRWLWKEYYNGCHFERLKEGIYPYTGEVKNKFQCRTSYNKKYNLELWFDCGESQYLGFINNGYEGRKVAILVEKTEASPTDKLKAMASEFKPSAELKSFGVRDATHEAFKILFTYFHGLGLRSHIDMTIEQDDVKYQLLFKPITSQHQSELESLRTANKELVEALKAITSNKHLHLPDLVYQIRDSEGEGWEGQWVTHWSDTLKKIDNLITKHS